jgi:hypothetical protein
MKQRPILFSSEMVQAILDGRKTQTRRLLKLQPKKNLEFLGWKLTEYIQVAFGRGAKIESLHKFPFGEVGDVLWVRETYLNFNSIDETPNYTYKADHPNFNINFASGEKWKPSIHMPKRASRIWLKITNVKVQRLQDISAEDAIKEGIKKHNHRRLGEMWYDYIYLGGCQDPITSFASLWCSINGLDSWYKNPWIWVIEFERIEKPI